MVKCECGSINPEDAKYCQECGVELKEYPSKYQNLSLLGVAGVFLSFRYASLLVLTLGIGLYMWTRPEEFAKKRGKFLIQFSVIMILVVLVINIII